MDAFTIVLPSETVLAGLSSTSVSLGAPNLVFLGLAAILGAHLGDLGVFMIGRLLARTRWFRGNNRVTRLLDWTRRRLDTQGPVYIMTARYIPYGRILVNAAAGSSGFQRPDSSLSRWWGVSFGHPFTSRSAREQGGGSARIGGLEFWELLSSPWRLALLSIVCCGETTRSRSRRCDLATGRSVPRDTTRRRNDTASTGRRWLGLRSQRSVRRNGEVRGLRATRYPCGQDQRS